MFALEYVIGAVIIMAMILAPMILVSIGSDDTPATVSTPKAKAVVVRSKNGAYGYSIGGFRTLSVYVGGYHSEVLAARACREAVALLSETDSNVSGAVALQGNGTLVIRPDDNEYVI